MKVGIPKGLLYPNYYAFMETFFEEIGAEIITSPDTNTDILNEGVKYCVDEACLPVKIFHGHVSWLRNKCDVIFIPRIMCVREREYICPKFCGLTEMITNSVPDLPAITGEPIHFFDDRKLNEWALKTGSFFTDNKKQIKSAIKKAIAIQSNIKTFVNNNGFKYKVALLGHPYNIFDSFLNMDLIKKLNNFDVGVVTEESVDEADIDRQAENLFKRPFWTFARKTYGAAMNLYENNEIEGIIYISSFACGIDSVVIELIKAETGNLPFLVLKIDEHTGEAGFDTRLEAFTDMLGRRYTIDDNNTPYGEYLSCS